MHRYLIALIAELTTAKGIAMTKTSTNRPAYNPNRGEQAMGILQSQLVRTGMRAAATKKAGLPELWNMHRAALFALLEVRRAMRFAKIGETA